MILLSQSILSNPTLWYESGASEYQDDAFAQVQHPHSTRNVGYNMCYSFKDYCLPLFLFSLIGVGMKLVIVNHLTCDFIVPEYTDKPHSMV